MKFYLFKENEEGAFAPFAVLYIEAETPEGQEDNPYDYMNSLTGALVEAYKAKFRWQDQNGKQSHIFQRSNHLLDDPKIVEAWLKRSDHFPGIDDLIKTGHQ